MFKNITALKPNHIGFDINDVDVSVVNAVRRTILTEVPTAAFAFDPNGHDNDIKVHTNTGALHNEFLCHRVSLLPINFKAEELVHFQPAQYRFVIKKRNTTDTMMEVTSADIQVYDSTGTLYPKELHERLFPADPITKDRVLITKLKPNLFDKEKGDAIDLEARATLNSGKAHARWCPVSLCTYFNIVDDEKAAEGLRAFIQQHESTGLDEQELRTRFNNLDKFRHFKRNKYDEPCAFHFDLESECGLSPAYIFGMGVDLLLQKVKDFAAACDDASRITWDNTQGMMYVRIKGEDHTLGNLLQAMLYNIYIREGASQDMKYVGYFKPHPLEDGIVIKVKCDGDAKALIQSGCAKIAEYIADISSQWKAAMA